MITFPFGIAANVLYSDMHAPQGVASTPFLAGLARTLPVLTPGITPGELQAALQAVSGRASPCASSPAQGDTAPATQHSSAPAAVRAGAAAQALTFHNNLPTHCWLYLLIQACMMFCAQPCLACTIATVMGGCVTAGDERSMPPASPADAWAGLADLTPTAKGTPWMDPSDAASMFQPSPAGQQLRSSSWDALMQGGGETCDSSTPMTTAAAPPAAKSTHKKRVSWGSRMEQVQVIPACGDSSAAEPEVHDGTASSSRSGCRVGRQRFACGCCCRVPAGYLISICRCLICLKASLAYLHP